MAPPRLLILRFLFAGRNIGISHSQGQQIRPWSKKKYRAGVIGLGWMGFLYDLGKRDYERISGSHQAPIYDVESADRPLPDGLDVNRTFHLYDHPGREGLATSYAAALFDRPEVELVAGADRDPRRRAMFEERYGIEALYADALAMLDEEATGHRGDCDECEGAIRADGGRGRGWSAGRVGR